MYLERFSVPGRVALVTGGGRGIGLGCVEALAEAGAKTIIADHDPGVAESGRDALACAGADILAPGRHHAGEDVVLVRPQIGHPGAAQVNGV